MIVREFLEIIDKLEDKDHPEIILLRHKHSNWFMTSLTSSILENAPSIVLSAEVVEITTHHDGRVCVGNINVDFEFHEEGSKSNG